MNWRRLFGLTVKTAVSAGFIAFLVSRVDAEKIAGIFRSCPAGRTVPLLASIVLFVPLLLAARWFVLLRGYLDRESPAFPLVLRLTMAGLFFNAVLPTGAGGDVVKIIYATRGRQKKLAVGSSVLVDRIVGSLTIMAMAAIAACVPGVVRREVAVSVGVLLFLVLLLATLLSKREWARVVFGAVKGLIPENARNRLVALYDAFAGYFRHRRVFACAVGVSALLQLGNILCQYGLAVALSGKDAPAIGWFFAAIPLIWLSNLVPSIGGIGVREFTYVFFFSSSMGRDAALALSLLVDLTIFIQAVAGGIVFLFLRSSPPAPPPSPEPGGRS